MMLLLTLTFSAGKVGVMPLELSLGATTMPRSRISTSSCAALAGGAIAAVAMNAAMILRYISSSLHRFDDALVLRPFRRGIDGCQGLG